MPIPAEKIAEHILVHLNGMPQEDRQEELEIMEAMYKVDQMANVPDFDAEVLRSALKKLPKEQ